MSENTKGTMSPFLSIQKVTKYYHLGESGAGNEVLRNISLDIGKKDFLCILGPSGCGKSTLLRCVGGFEQFEGTILLDGIPVREPGADRIMVFQDFNQLFPWKTVLGNVQYPLKRQGALDKDSIVECAKQVLIKVGLGEYLNYYPHQLSGGMKQRAAIARALVLKPKVILMDEPFASLDAITREKLQQELLTITSGEDITVLFVTHNIQEALFLGSRILIMSNQGKILINEPNLLPKPVKLSSPGYAEVWERYSQALQY